jgi:hypothetical protein
LMTVCLGTWGRTGNPEAAQGQTMKFAALSERLLR